MRYRLERLVDGQWFHWGTYKKPERLAEAAFELGKMGYEQIRVIPEATE